MYWYQDPTVFKNENPQNVQQQTPWTGDGTTTVFSTTVNNTLSITAEWIGTDAGNTIRSQNFTLTKSYLNGNSTLPPRFHNIVNNPDS